MWLYDGALRAKPQWGGGKVIYGLVSGYFLHPML